MTFTFTIVLVKTIPNPAKKKRRKNICLHQGHPSQGPSWAEAAILSKAWCKHRSQSTSTSSWCMAVTALLSSPKATEATKHCSQGFWKDLISHTYWTESQTSCIVLFPQWHEISILVFPTSIGYIKFVDWSSKGLAELIMFVWFMDGWTHPQSITKCLHIPKSH